MPKPIRRRRCAHCNELFRPDVRNATRQKFCSKPECRKASKAASQKRWLEKVENRDYFRGPHHVDRVREWRRKNPDYGRRKASRANDSLQDSLSEKTQSQQAFDPILAEFALQDPFSVQDLAFIGLIANLTGLALQDDIAAFLRFLQQLGSDIVDHPKQGAAHD